MAVPSSAPSPDYMDHEIVEVVVNQDSAVVQDYEATEAESKASFARTCLNACNAISGAVLVLNIHPYYSFRLRNYAFSLGVFFFALYDQQLVKRKIDIRLGVLSMPYAFSLGGWLSLIIFIIIAGICYYTGLLIQRCMDADPAVQTYPSIGEHAFGPKGKLIICIFMYLELYLVTVGFLILEGDNLDKLFPGKKLEIASVSVKGKRLFILLSALVILPTTWVQNLALLSYVSAGGVAASAVLLCSLLWAGIVDTGFHQRGRIFDWSGLPSALGLYFMCFTCHAVFPTIRSSMKDTHRFPKVLSFSFVLCTLNYGLVGIIGYLMYGDELQSQVTLNLPVRKLYTSIAIYVTLITPAAKFALYISPIARAIEQSMTTHYFQGRLASMVIRSALLCGTVIIALAIPFFASLMSFVGSFLCVVVSVLFPCVCYLKIFGFAGVARTQLAVIIGIVVVGIVVVVLGTYSSVRDVINRH